MRRAEIEEKVVAGLIDFRPMAVTVAAVALPEFLPLNRLRCQHAVDRTRSRHAATDAVNAAGGTCYGRVSFGSEPHGLEPSARCAGLRQPYPIRNELTSVAPGSAMGR